MRRQRFTISMVALMLVSGVGCSQEDRPTGSVTGGTVDTAVAAEAFSPLFDHTAPGQWRSLGDDQFEVWVCRVPAGATDPFYGGLELRLPFTPAEITEVVTEHVTPYFESLSHGQYRPVFVVGGEATLGVDDAPQVCIDQAIEGAGPDARGVLVVADAEHGADQGGGFGSGGGECTAAPPCAVAESRRFAYVGASDFHPDWGDDPPMDLVQHELGHTLGWQHSAVEPGGLYLSALDLMSNSAGPRDTEPDRRDGPGTLAVNQLTAGWMPLADVWVAPAEGGSVMLQPSAAASGVRLAVVACCADRLLAIERFEPVGFYSHLPIGGVTVHEVQWTQDGAITMTPLVGTAPFTDLLQPGDSLATIGGLVEIGADFTVSVTPGT